MGPLSDIRVLDTSTVLAGPGAARYLADFGADVIKVEQSGVGDSARGLGWRDETDGQSLFFKGANRNKRFIELDLKAHKDKERFLELLGTSQVLIENMRPGKFEALGLDPAELVEQFPGLVVLRVTAFGQDGPYKDRPGFATLAEAMSGFASINGAADGPPTLPPIALTDEVTALAGAFAVMVAVHSGVGQVIDVNLLESLIQMMGPLPSLWLNNGEMQPRLGSGLPYTVPRGTYLCSDGEWIAISTSAESVAARVMELIGLGDDPRTQTALDRMNNRDLIESAMVAWVSQRTQLVALAELEAADAAASAVYDMSQLASDSHVIDRQIFKDVGGYKMAGPIARLSATPGEVKWAARPRGADNDEILGELQ